MTGCDCSYHAPHLDLKYLCRDYFTERDMKPMTRDEHDALCEVEAREFFIWLDGFNDGIGAADPGTSQALRIYERLSNLQMRWIDRGNRASASSEQLCECALGECFYKEFRNGRKCRLGINKTASEGA